jgi:hypothetical protein
MTPNSADKPKISKLSSAIPHVKGDNKAIKTNNPQWMGIKGKER